MRCIALCLALAAGPLACGGEETKRFEAPSLASTGKPWTQPNAELPWDVDAGQTALTTEEQVDALNSALYEPAGEDWPTWGFVPWNEFAIGDERIERGELTIERLDAYDADGLMTALLPAPLALAQAVGNREYRPIAELPDAARLLHLSGHFESAQLGAMLPFEAIVIGDFSLSSEAILYAPEPPLGGGESPPCLQIQTLDTLPVINDNGRWLRGTTASEATIASLLEERSDQTAIDDLLFELPACTVPVHPLGLLTKLPTPGVEDNPAPCAPACSEGQLCIDAVCISDAPMRITARWNAYASDLEMVLELPSGERLGERFLMEGLFYRQYTAGSALIELEGGAGEGIENLIVTSPATGTYRLRLRNGNVFASTTYLASEAATAYQVDVAVEGRLVHTFTGTLPDTDLTIRRDDNALSIEHVINYPPAP